MRTVGPGPNLIGVCSRTTTQRKKPRHSTKATRLLISGITALTGVLVTLAKGTTYNTITLKKVAATVASKTDLNFRILEKKILTCEAVQTFKLYTKICFLTGQYGPR